MMRHVTSPTSMTSARPHEIAAYHRAALQHRRDHGCDGYPFGDGARLQALVRDASARRVLELGTAAGFSAFCFATARPGVLVDTIDRDPEHVALAGRWLEDHGVADRVRAHHGEFADVLARLSGPYDLVFVDGFEADPALLGRLVQRTAGILVSANLSWSATAASVLSRLDELGWDSRREGDIAVSRRREGAA